MKTVVLATNNPHKVSEIISVIGFPGWEFKTLSEMGITSDPEEDADTFEGNARIKAQAARAAANADVASLADDSGLVVDALGGLPGVHSSRYASEDGSNADDKQNNLKLLRELANVPDDQRTARFVSTLVFIDNDGTEFVATGTVEGVIGHEERGDGGFGYDPLFWPDVFDHTCTLAEVTQEQKNAVSHRGNALRALRDDLISTHQRRIKELAEAQSAAADSQSESETR